MTLAIHDCWNQIGVHGDSSCKELPQHVHCRNCPVYSSAAADLFQREPPSGYLEDLSEHYARPLTHEDTSARSVVIFRVSQEWLALPATLFEEVVEWRPIHTLPHRRTGFLLGLANVRGQLLVCISMRDLLQIEKTADVKLEKQSEKTRRLLVIHREGTRVVFPVDEVHGTHRCRSNDFREIPGTLAKATATYTEAVFAWKNRTAGLLNENLLFETLSRSFV